MKVRHKFNSASRILLTIAILISITSCKKAKPPASPQAGANTPIPAIDTAGGNFGGDTWLAQQAANEQNVSAGAGQSYAHVTYKPNVKVFDESALEPSLEGVGSDGHGIVFKNAPAPVLALKAGDILMVKNQFVAKILAAETDGDETVLITDSAKLSDIVQDGEINLDTPITFHGPQIAVAQPSLTFPALPMPQASTQQSRPPFHFMDIFETPVYAQNGTGTPAEPNSLTPSYNTSKPGVTTGSPTSQFVDAATALLSGWTVESWSVTPSQNDAVINAKMTKSTGGFVAAISMTGTVSNFQFIQKLKFPVQSSQLMNAVHGLSGQMHFVWEIGKQTPGVWATEDKIKLPAGITIPLAEMLDGLPLTLDISAALLIHPALTGGNEYSKGGFTIGFDGNSSGMGLTFKIDEDQSISPIAPNAMVIAFCVPRVELKLGATWSDKFSKVTAAVDKAISWVKSKLPASVQAAINNSPLSKMSVTNALASSADLFVQVIHTEGVTHASNITPAPCSKIELKVSGQWGGDATLFDLVPNASATRDLFTKTFTRWNPASDFCKSV
jgi:hypothetical protein